MNEKELLVVMRWRKKISQKELALHLKCSQSLISRWEKDECNMSDDKIKKYKEYIENK